MLDMRVVCFTTNQGRDSQEEKLVEKFVEKLVEKFVEIYYTRKMENLE